MYRIIRTDQSIANIFIRLMVGAVFLSEGIQKFLFPELRGVGRFELIGIPNPDVMAVFVATAEVVCGTFVLIGLLTRLATIPLLIIMIIALSMTKAELLSQSGFWEMAHQSRTDWAMLLGTIFLLISGGGKWSFDRKFMGRTFER